MRKAKEWNERVVSIRAEITRLSLSRGLLPKVCPVCGNILKGDWLETHHWGCGEGYWGYIEALKAGKLRRMCASCNRLLGLHPEAQAYNYSGEKWYWYRWFRIHGDRLYLDSTYTWEEQFEMLSEYFTSDKKRYLYPNFDGVERPWSRFLPVEEELFRKMLKELGYDL